MPKRRAQRRINGRQKKKPRGAAYAASVRRIKPMTNVAYVQKGFLRQGGYYGRFGPGSEELKFFRDSTAATQIANNGTLLQPSLVLVSQGTGESQRIGRKITIKKIGIHGQIITPSYINATGLQPTAARMRIVVFWDKQANGAAPSVGDVLGQGSGVTTFSFNNLSNKNRFTIITNRVYDINVNSFVKGNSDTTWTLPQNSISFSLYKNVNIPIEYGPNAGAATLADIKSNNIGIICICSDDLLHEVIVRTQVRYSDS